jgi:UPF0755 protein
LKENGFNENNVFVVCIPNTYEIYWNTSADKFRDKMIKEYRKFWNKERVTKAKEQGLTPIDYLGFYSTQESVKKKTKDRGLRGLLEPLKVGNATKRIRR